MLTSCTCCESEPKQCPAHGWLTLHSWVGSYIIPNDLKFVHLAPFRLRFSFGGVVEETGLLTRDSTIGEVTTALESLSNVGPGVVVLTENGLSGSGQLPDTLWIYFSSPLTQGQDVPLLEVISTGIPNWKVGVIREGSSGVDEIQSISFKPGVWDSRGLDEYEDSVWQWRVVVRGTGDIPDGTEICLAQNRKDWEEWVAPIGDYPDTTYFQLKLTEIKYTDSLQVSTLVGGSFELNMTVEGDVESVTSPFNVSNTSLKSSLVGLPNSGYVGTILVSGGILPLAPITVAFRVPTRDVLLTASPNDIPGSVFLIGTDPVVDVLSVSDGGLGIDEVQILSYSWPAHAGSFTVSVTANGSTQTTAAIPYNADGPAIQSALLALSNLNTPPTVTVSVIYPGNGSAPGIQEISIQNKAVVSGGTFQLILTVNGATRITAPIPHNAPIGQIQSALLALTNLLPTDDFLVTRVNDSNYDPPFPFRVTFVGSLGTSTIPPMVAVSSLTGGDVRVTSTTESMSTYNPTVHTKHTVRFVGTLFQTDVPLMTTSSSLRNYPVLSVGRPAPSNASAFRNWLDPLNVGTMWKHYLRAAYGNVENRQIRTSMKVSTVNEFEPPIPGSLDITEMPCGYGIYQPGFCQSEHRPNWAQAGVRQTGEDSVTAKAEFIYENGTISVQASLPWHFAIQIRCLGCYYSSEFNLWGIHENSVNESHQIYDILAPEDFEPQSAGSCGGPDVFKSPGDPDPLDPSTSRQWSYRPGNVPYLFRKKNGPDGYDGHLINDKFYADGATRFRKPPCSPGVVFLGGGFWLKQFYSRGFYKFSCSDIQYAVTGYPYKRSFPPRPYHEYEEECPTTDVERLKAIYGTHFSWWGGWIDPESISLPKIRCTFDKYDLEDVEVLFLGGFPIGKVPQEDNRSGADWADPGWTGSILHEQPGDNFFAAGDANWRSCVDREFETHTLEPLKRWLNLGGKVLVLDGGIFPQKFLTEMGIGTTVEPLNTFPRTTPPTITPYTLNGSVFTTPVFGPVLPDWLSQQYHEPWFPACYVEPLPHPFTGGVHSAFDSFGNVQRVGAFEAIDGILPIGPGSDISGSSIAGDPLGGPSLPCRGLLNISQKYSYDTHLYNGFLIPNAVRSYTTAVPKVVPGPGAIVIGSVRGQLPIYSSAGLHPPITGFVDLDYPGVVVEHWASGFTIRFTFNGTTEETGVLSFTSTASEIQTALEGLANIGPGMNVLGTALPGSLEIHFDAPLVAGQNVPRLQIVGSPSVQMKIVREGSVGVNEVQRIEKGIGPSRIVISGVCELVEPDEWGTNWEGLTLDGDRFTQYHQENDDRVFVWHVGPGSECEDPTSKIELTYYGKRGYNFGLGLSHIASARFLANLWVARHDY